MRKTDGTTRALISLFYDTQNYFARPYSCLSIDTMKDRLKVLHKIDITYAGVCKQLLKMRKIGLIKTFPRRFVRAPDGTIRAIPPNRSLTVRALRWLKKTSVTVSKVLWDHVKGIEKMPRVTSKDIARQHKSWTDFKDKNIKRIANLIPGIGKPFPEPS